MDKRKVFVLGDSISIHYGPFLERFLQSEFSYARKTGQEPELIGDNTPKLNFENGGGSDLVLRYLELMKESLSTDYLILNCGLHDLRFDPKTETYQAEIGKYVENLRQICELVATQVIWVNSTPINDERHNSEITLYQRFDKDVQRYNLAAAEVMSAAAIPIIDLYTFTKTFGDKYVDHAHFTDEVRMAQGVFIAGFVRGMTKEIFKQSA